MRRLSSRLAQAALSALFVVLMAAHASGLIVIAPMQRAEAWLYDSVLRWTAPSGPDDRIAILDIDEASLKSVGRWPWNRDQMAVLVDQLFDRYGVAAVGFDVVFAEPDTSSGLDSLKRIAQHELAGNRDFQAVLKQIAPRLDYDARFAQALADRPVSLGYYFIPAGSGDAKTGRLPPPSLPVAMGEGAPTGYGANQAVFQDAAQGAGFFNMLADPDGTARQMQLLTPYGAGTYLALSASTLRVAFGGDPVTAGEQQIKVLGRRYVTPWIEVGGLRVPLGANGAVHVPYRAGAPFPYISAGAVLAGTAPLALASTLALLAALAAAYAAAWSRFWVVPMAAPMLTVAGLYALNTAYGFFATTRSKRQMTKLFGQYVPPELAAEMSLDPAHYTMEGQSREMSVLFSDIRGFTDFSEKLPPAELAAVLNAYLSTMTRIVQQHRGTIDKYIGDAIMAFWNAPVDFSDHASRAVQTALDMQAALPQLNQEFAARNWPEVKIGVGVNTGRMSVGNMGSEFRQSYTVMGDAVNLGSRLEGITKQYGVGILVTQPTVEADPQHAFMKIDEVRVKGKALPVAIYEPLGAVAGLPDALKADAAAFEAAFARYQAQDWNAAEVALDALNARAPRTLYTIYLERIAHFRTAPPPADWDGVFVYTTK
ncbi:MAG: adenylate/guanylate cyclase domain-containing protein [Hydrogenophilales bacterium 32-62-9]|nr:MAG: adenylate/guanylate cyclase domain-containing protein [Hydrogenophilales bacterium 32-62-9]